MSHKSVAVVAPPAKVVPLPTIAAEPSKDEIAARAHQLYEKRGSEPGHELEDWLQAERELKAQQKN